MKSKSTNIAGIWNEWIGDSGVFSIESRIFHAVALMASLIMLVNGTASLFVGLSGIVYFTFAFIPVLIFAFYLSRFRDRMNISLFIFAFVSYTECIVAYFVCGGEKGVTLLLVLAITFILAVICPKYQLKYWLATSALILFGLLTAEFLHPEWIMPIYDNDAIRLIDQGQAYFMIFMFFALVTYYIKDNYYNEKSKADVREVELVSLNESKNKLFSIVAHDLRSPLASIQNYLELLKQVYLTDEEKENIQDHLLHSTKSTSEMLSNILSWTKAQMDGISLNLVRFSVSRVLHNTLQVQFLQAKAKGIELNYPESSDLTMFADPDMMQLVVRNLLNNAIKFTPSGGKIWIEYSEDDLRFTIMIRDTGIGIAKKNHAEIFSLKSQSTFGTDNEKGVGLGLVLTKSYVELQNGTISLESEEGKGTTFLLTFQKD
ncbi:sensor histidine kinase [Pedobacter sp. AW31-3R]|uniref:sensor histidine kinase n=1 Tax=Pedobacter sp. AW31-3R TaxID=3445781 RepID=UPI003F9FE8DB